MLISRYAGVCNRISFYRRSSDAFEQKWYRQKYNKFVNSLVYKNSTKIFSNSEHAIDFFFPYRNPGDNRFKVIPNGIDPTTFNLRENKSEARRYFNLPPDRFIIGHVGRYDPAKNHETIFKVAKRLKSEEPNIIFLFAGRATDRGDFLDRVHFYGIEDICFCLGLQTKIPFLYKT
jgi:glycosyltransferase involved in cell wall biosynthesis